MKMNRLFVFLNTLISCTNTIGMEHLPTNPDIIQYVCIQTTNAHTSLNLLSICKSARALLLGCSATDLYSDTSTPELYKKQISHFIVNTPTLFSSLNNRLCRQIGHFVVDNNNNENPTVIKIRKWYALTLQLRPAVAKNDIAEVEKLLSKGAHCNYMPAHFTMPLLHLACKNGNVKIAKLLLKHGALINEVDSYGCNALSLIVYEQNPDATKGRALLQLLIKHGIDINKTDQNKTPALLYACLNDDFEAAKFLVEHGALATASCMATTDFNRFFTNANNAKAIQKLCSDHAEPMVKLKRKKLCATIIAVPLVLCVMLISSFY